jgi:hypothetical protein
MRNNSSCFAKHLALGGSERVELTHLWDKNAMAMEKNAQSSSHGVVFPFLAFYIRISV